MIEATSILLRLPSRLEPKEMLFLDGMRHAVEIAAYAYTRLQGSLTTAAHAPDGAEQDFTGAYLDAWAVVDAIHRFRMLWLSLPEMRQHTSVRARFEAKTQDLTSVRNVNDHPDQMADHVLSRKGAALGVLDWITPVSQSDDGTFAVIISMMRPGHLLDSKPHKVALKLQEVELPSGPIHLTAGKARANLSEAMQATRAGVNFLERLLTSRYIDIGPPEPSDGRDTFASFKVRKHFPGRAKGVK